MKKDDFHTEKTIPPLVKTEKESFFEIPKIVGSFKIESLFEKGGMSLLYLGTHLETLEPAIIKVLPQKYLSNQEITDRFLKEADIISIANHPNIVKLYGKGKWEGGLYLAIEFVQGISLRQYILQKHVSLKRAVEMIIEIAYALCHLHMHGIIHRDLKPENIIVPETGSIKVIDFGIAQVLSEDVANKIPAPTSFIGTPIYMSPEQKENPETVSYPSDIYSLGIIAYELVLGRLSFGQLHLGLMPKGLRKILSKALLADPKLRYQDVVDFISDISAYLNSPAIKEEQDIGDQISELSENLQNTQAILLKEKPPLWKELEIGIATHKEISPLGLQQGIYQDFFEIPQNTYGIIIADSSLKNRESLVYTAATRGMIRALCRLTTKPDELAILLNDLVVNDPLRHQLSLNYITIELEAKLLHYISCGQGMLFYLNAKEQDPKKIENKNEWIGQKPLAEFNSTSHSFHTGDILLLASFSGAILKSQQLLEDEIVKSIRENKTLPAHELSAKILKRLKLIFSKTIYESVISLITIKRLS
ncbi:MAG TPA: protein kinase [Parachlamydiaceae bacterium]|nr:protein kinase [Parachlamydiaceae bacterium]